MEKQYLEIGKIINTHGIKGEIKVQPWCDTPEFLAGFETLYWQDGSAVHVLGSKVHKGNVLLKLEGIDTIEKAETYKNRILYMDREDAPLDDGAVYLQDMIGLIVYDKRLSREIGRLQDVQETPSHDLYIVRDKGKDYLIPAVDEFIKEIDLERGVITIQSIEGLIDDAD